MSSGCDDRLAVVSN